MRWTKTSTCDFSGYGPWVYVSNKEVRNRVLFLTVYGVHRIKEYEPVFPRVEESPKGKLSHYIENGV